MTPTTVTERRSEQTTDQTAIRPFSVEVPEEELTELRRRISRQCPERRPQCIAAQRFLELDDVDRRGERRT